MRERLERWGRYLENLLLAALLLGMIGIASGQILLRELNLGTLVWGDEAIRLMVLWIAMVAGVAAAREDRHIAIDVLSRFLPRRGKTVAAAVVDLFTAVVCALLAWYALRMVGFALEDGETVLGGVPAWWLQAILPAGFALIAWRYLLWFGRRIRTVFGGYN